MSTQPWRGTLIFAGTRAAIAATAAARFSGAEAATASTAATGTGSSTTSGTTSGSTGTSSGTTSGSSSSSGSSSATGTQSGTTSGTKTIVGSTVQTRYGPVQVSVTFTSGKITAVQALQTPSGHESTQINAYAAPLLAQEAVAANSANIDTVSGATFTSQAYAQSLQSAIDKLG